MEIIDIGHGVKINKELTKLDGKECIEFKMIPIIEAIREKSHLEYCGWQFIGENYTDTEYFISNTEGAILSDDGEIYSKDNKSIMIYKYYSYDIVRRMFEGEEEDECSENNEIMDKIERLERKVIRAFDLINMPEDKIKELTGKQDKTYRWIALKVKDYVNHLRECTAGLLGAKFIEWEQLGIISTKESGQYVQDRGLYLIEFDEEIIKTHEEETRKMSDPDLFLDHSFRNLQHDYGIPIKKLTEEEIDYLKRHEYKRDLIKYVNRSQSVLQEKMDSYLNFSARDLINKMADLYLTEEAEEMILKFGREREKYFFNLILDILNNSKSTEHKHLTGKNKY